MLAQQRCTQENDILWMSQNGQGNLCVFNMRAALAARSFWSGRSEVTKEEAVFMETNRHPLSAKLLPVKQRFVSTPSTEGKSDALYNASVPRVVVYFASLDVTKYCYNMVNPRGGDLLKHPNEPFANPNPRACRAVPSPTNLPLL